MSSRRCHLLGRLVGAVALLVAGALVPDHARAQPQPGESQAKATYVVEISPNLMNWFGVQTNTMPPVGFLDLVDPSAGSVNRRAYRAYLKP